MFVGAELIRAAGISKKIQVKFLTCDSEDATLRESGKSAKEGDMSLRETALRNVGVEIPSASENYSVPLSSPIISDYSFSGYGEFTPITVRADTVIPNADMERNKQRN